VIRVYDEAGNVIETHEHVGDALIALSATDGYLSLFRLRLGRGVR
jgi:hypothetical protein